MKNPAADALHASDLSSTRLQVPKRQIVVKLLAEALLGLGVGCKRPSCPPVPRSGRGARQNTAGCAAKGV